VRLLLATRNPHKVREFAALLAPHGVDPLPADVELPPETGATFAATGRVAIADDSGIEAAALGGAPGVHSARYAGEHATDEENLQLLLREAPDGSGLAYVCALAWVDPAGAEHVVEGRCTGTLTRVVRGDGGFGYDPAFVPDDDASGRTMAELSAAEKDAISHRGRALRELQAWLTSR